jgi:adenosylcobinamide-GDP ribazoletransferase
MTRQLQLFFAALQYFTRLPVPPSVGHSQQLLNDAARFFPLVGLVVGIIVASTLYLASWLWPAPIAVLLALAMSLWITGAFHEDGLADAIDGLGGGYDRAQCLAIMRDSRIGTYGTVALILSLGLRASVLIHLPVLPACILVVTTHVVSRAAAVTIMYRLPYAREDASRAKPLVEHVSRNSLLIAVFTALVALLIGSLFFPLLWVTSLAVIISTLLWMRVLKKTLQGYTGDCLGAAQQFAELALYLAALALWSI